MNPIASSLFLVLLFSPYPTFGVVGGSADQAPVKPFQGGRAVAPGHLVSQDGATVFDTKLTRPTWFEDEIPLNANGVPDFDYRNYACYFLGAREVQAYHRIGGGLNRVSLGALQSVLVKEAREREKKIPENPLALLTSFPSLRIDEVNRGSEHLLRMRGGDVLNVAAYANVVRSGRNPQESLGEWIHPLQGYADHHLTYETNARYIAGGLRTKEPVIRDYIDHSVDDPETSRVLHFFFATPLVGWQTFKAITFLIGLKNAGKSVTLNLVCSVFGSYTMTVPPIYMLAFNEDRLTKELFAGFGKRILRIDELNGEMSFNEPVIKRIGGRDGLANPFVTHPVREFTPQVKLFCDSNAPLKPQVGNESTISDRLYYVPYGKVIPAGKRNPHFEKELATQENLDTYFSWLVDTYLMDVVQGRLS
jgi:hypothetical protein